MPRPPDLERAETPPRIRVAAGILQDASGRVLIAERPNVSCFTGLWEFPGGKFDGDESAADALCRELYEELGVVATEFRHLMTVEHDYEHRAVTLEFFVVTRWEGTVAAREGQGLRWIDSRCLDGKELLPANAPVVDALQRSG